MDLISPLVRLSNSWRHLIVWVIVMTNVSVRLTLTKRWLGQKLKIVWMLVLPELWWVLPGTVDACPGSQRVSAHHQGGLGLEAYLVIRATLNRPGTEVGKLGT